MEGALSRGKASCRQGEPLRERILEDGSGRKTGPVPGSERLKDPSALATMLRSSTLAHARRRGEPDEWTSAELVVTRLAASVAQSQLP
jgi:hypothetical protein